MAAPFDSDPSSLPPGASDRARRVMRRLVRPVEAFLATESASGVVLLAVTIAALGWANGPWRESYAWLWSLPVGLRIGSFAFEEPLRFWVNEVAMTLFFFVVGLEIRREMHRGELSTWRRAALPFGAAIGGMVVPAALYAAINAGGSASSGWGIPMATDIAFAVGVLTLLGSRVSPAVRVLLLALAVIDDVGAILVIGVFYSNDFAAGGLAIAAAGVLAIVVLQRIGVRRVLAYVPPGALVWWGMHEAHVHPTLAGVAVGLLTPVQAWYGPSVLASAIGRVSAAIERVRSDGRHDEIAPHLHALEHTRREAIAPLDRLQHDLHGIVAFVVMPLFALANAGVTIGGLSFEGGALRGAVGILLGLVAGKPLGIVLGCLIVVRVLRLGGLPRGVSWRALIVMGFAGGIGFTMSLFITDLAFADPALGAVGKLGVLVASLLAGLLAVGFGRAALRREDRGARTETEAESSDAL